MSASGLTMWTLIVCLLLLSSRSGSEEVKESPKIGIVGGGIGGTSAAYFFRQQFGDNANIDVIEKAKIGGRLQTIKIGNHQYEAGGHLIHPQNMYMVNFTNILGLERLEQPNDGTLGIFDGTDMRVSTSKYSLVTLAKLFWRYGFDIYNLKTWINEKLLSKFMRIYDIQNAGYAYTSVQDLIGAMDPVFVSYMKRSIKQLMRAEGYSEIFIDELVMGAMRTNYGQTTALPGFVGAVSLAGIQPGLWVVKDGNKQVPEKLITKANAQLIEGNVQTVRLLQYQDHSYQIDYIGQDKKLHSKDYDIVVIATPLHDDVSEIEFEDFPGQIDNFPQKYHKLTVTFVDGVPNGNYFGVEKDEDVPEDVLTCNDTILVNSLGKQTSILGQKSKNVFKLFSNVPPNEKNIAEMFKQKKDIRMFSTMAYPDYSSLGEDIPPFVLHDQLYYVNAIEFAASAMEMSALSARNIALLAYNHWKGNLDKIDEPYVDPAKGEKTEL